MPIILIPGKLAAKSYDSIVLFQSIPNLSCAFPVDIFSFPPADISGLILREIFDLIFRSLDI
jgi:hypothetical protein